MSPALVSIVIPTYNAVKYIEQTIRSCLNQTYGNIEIIIQDDFSEDGTWELLNNLYSSIEQIQIYRNDKNLGIGGNWNAAYKHATGDFIVIFNADDLLVPDFISEFLKVFDSNKDIDIVTGKFQILDSKTGGLIPYPGHVSIEGGVVQNLFLHLYFKLSFSWVFSLVKRELLERVKFENGDLFINTQVCDYDLWYRCFVANAKVFFNDEKDWGYYRKHETNSSSKENGELKSFMQDFLHFHENSFKRLAGMDYSVKLIRNFLTFCNSGKFDLQLFILFIKRIIHSFRYIK